MGALGGNPNANAIEERRTCLRRFVHGPYSGLRFRFGEGTGLGANYDLPVTPLLFVTLIGLWLLSAVLIGAVTSNGLWAVVIGVALPFVFLTTLSLYDPGDTALSWYYFLYLAGVASALGVVWGALWVTASWKRNVIKARRAPPD